MKLVKIVFLLTLILVLAGVSFAADQTDMSSTSEPSTDKIQQDNSVNTYENEIVKANDKQIIKQNISSSTNNMKTAGTKTVYVKSSKQLINELTETNTTITTKTINLKKGTYKINTNIKLKNQKYTTIIINGNNSVIQGTSNTQFLNISSKYDVTLKKLNIKNFKNTNTINTSSYKKIPGNNSGAIANYGKLTIYNCTFQNNKYSYKEVGEDSGVIISEYANSQEYYYAGAGGIYNKGTLSIEKSNFISNTGFDSGAIFNKGTINLKTSTFNNNKAFAAGAIFNKGTLKIYKTNFLNNKADDWGYAGAIRNEKTLTINNAQFKNNKCMDTATIYNLKNLNIKNTVFEKNKGSTIIYTSKKAIINATLKNNKASYSPIFNIASNTVITGTFNNNEGYYGGAIYNSGKNVKIVGNFTKNLAKRNGGAIHNTGTLKVDKSIFNNNKIKIDKTLGLEEEDSQTGGAIYNEGTLTVTNSNFKNHNITLDGSAISNKKTLTVRNSKFTKNDGNYGVISSDGSLKIYSSVFNKNYCDSVYSREDNAIIQGNFTNNKGGALYTYGSNLKITGNFTNNRGNSGSIVIQGENANIKGNFKNNVATIFEGGAIEVYGNNAKIVGNFTNNVAKKREGGAIVIYGDNADIQGTFKNNKAVRGGAISLNGKTTIHNSQFINNQATKEGGAIYVTAYKYSDSYWQSKDVKIYANFMNNTAKRGGAIFVNNDCKNLVINSNFTENHVTISGGAIYNSASNAVIKGIFNYNYARGKYNFINNQGTNCQISVTPQKYKFSKYGGAIYNKANNVNINIESTQKTPIEQLKTIIDINNIATVYVGSDVTISGKFTDEIGNKLKYSRLTLTFNDKKDTVKTDINGQFTYKYTTTKYGTNTVTISHPGNDNYQKTSSQKTFTVNGPKNITVYTFYTDEYAVPVSEGDDEIYSYFEDRYESQSGPGVWVDIHNRYAQRLDDLAPTHRILSATFVFANDYTGQIKTKTVSPQYYDFASTSLISGYTPVKVVLTIRNMTSYETDQWYKQFEH